MLPLANWIMQGRGQALVFVLITLTTSPVFWPNSILAAAAISLVWLRMGTREGAMLLAFAILPAMAMALSFNSFMPLLLVTGATLTSWVLKVTVSWPYTLMAMSACGAFSALGLESFAQQPLMEVAEAINGFLNELKQQLGQAELTVVLPGTIETVFVAGLFGTMQLVGTFVSVITARFWQARLFNPGGFQKEFHQLRLGKKEVVLLLCFTVLFFELGKQYLTWAWFALFPMLIAGIALFHAVARIKKLAMHWYVLFYVVLMLWDPLKIVLVGLAIADSFSDFRNRLPQSNTD